MGKTGWVSRLPFLFKSGSLQDQGEAAQSSDTKDLPKHIAIIMDGNGRWAKNRGLSRQFGHRSGAKALKEIVKACADMGIKYLTVYAFSTENWKRSQEEVDFLMSLLVEELYKEKPDFLRHGIKVRAVGDTQGLPQYVQDGFKDIEETTVSNDVLTLNIAVNYGARQEITNAAKLLATKVLDGEIRPENITEDDFAACLYMADQPDPDLLIRTSGECRISNYLLWQIAYSEFYFTEVLWPDFDKECLKDAILSYQNRDRRFGGRKETGVKQC